MTVTATLDHPAPADGTRVTLATAGTAMRDTGAGGDYALSATTITIAEGETTGTATITVTDDTEEDGGETIVPRAASANPALTAALTLTIGDNHGPLPTTLTLSADPAPAEGGPEVTVTATLDHPAPADETRVTLATAGTATRDTGAGGDYALSAATITIAAGATTGTATITVTDDAEEDGGETIILDAESTNPALTPEPLTLTIEDDDAAPPATRTLTAAPAPAEGGPDVTVTATLDHPAPADGTRVTLATAGTATRDTSAGGDYTLSSTTITIAEGATTGTATITVRHGGDLQRLAQSRQGHVVQALAAPAREDERVPVADRSGRVENLFGPAAQRDTVLPLRLRPRGRDGPHVVPRVDLVPPCSTYLVPRRISRRSARGTRTPA